MGVGLFVLGVVVAAVYLVMHHRRRAAASLAARLGMNHHRDDDLDVATLPHPIFRMGDHRRAHNLVVGLFQGVPMVLFDYEYTEERSDQAGRPSGVTSAYSGVLTRLPSAMPSTVIRRERFTTKVANALGLGRDTLIGHDDFDRTFEVRGSDPTFVSTLLEPELIDWLLAEGRELDIQIAGSDLVVIAERRPWARMEALAETVVELRRHMPADLVDGTGEEE